MYTIIEGYINKLTKEDIKTFALSKNTNLSDEEVEFTYNFIKKNYQDILKNPNILDIDRYKNRYSEENFLKIKQIYTEYLQKFARYL